MPDNLAYIPPTMRGWQSYHTYTLPPSVDRITRPEELLLALPEAYLGTLATTGFFQELSRRLLALEENAPRIDMIFDRLVRLEANLWWRSIR